MARAARPDAGRQATCSSTSPLPVSTTSTPTTARACTRWRLPYTLGLEGAGTVVEVGDEVTGVAVGDRVAWASAPGSYAQQAVVPARGVMKVPSDVSLEVAAAVPLQGMTAHYLMKDAYKLAAGEKVLIHAGAGGIGLLLIQIAKLIGAEVFTTVGSDGEGRAGKGAGADHVILYREVDFGNAVEAIAGTRPLDVVYDGVGKSVFKQSLGPAAAARDDGHVRQRQRPGRPDQPAGALGQRHRCT